MRILIADDDATSRFLLEATLKQWDYQVVATSDGEQALAALQREDGLRLAILDWMMPGMDGVEVCRQVRAHPGGEHFYLLMLTTLDAKEDIALALQAGANDYLSKPFDRSELQARLQVGCRVLDLQQTLAERVVELEAALQREQHLQGLLPICSYCKKIRDDHNYWQQVERYIEDHARVAFSHSICPDCYKNIVEPELEAFQAQQRASRQPSDPSP
jgi:CheY-like chemotaxis protein